MRAGPTVLCYFQTCGCQIFLMLYQVFVGGGRKITFRKRVLEIKIFINIKNVSSSLEALPDSVCKTFANRECLLQCFVCEREFYSVIFFFHPVLYLGYFCKLFPHSFFNSVSLKAWQLWQKVFVRKKTKQKTSARKWKKEKEKGTESKEL